MTPHTLKAILLGFAIVLACPLAAPGQSYQPCSDRGDISPTPAPALPGVTDCATVIVMVPEGDSLDG